MFTNLADGNTRATTFISVSFSIYFKYFVVLFSTEIMKTFVRDSRSLLMSKKF